MNAASDVLNYVKLVRQNDKTAQEDKYKTGLYAGLAYLQKGDTTSAVNEFDYTISNTKTIAAAEAKYNIANIQYLKRQYKTSQKTCFDLAKEMPNYDYWIAKTYILLADDYVGLKDTFQAKATLQSIIDNYKGNDDFLSTAQQKLNKLVPPSARKNVDEVKPDTTQNTKPVKKG
jgi:TolA-binding protein